MMGRGKVVGRRRRRIKNNVVIYGLRGKGGVRGRVFLFDRRREKKRFLRWVVKDCVFILVFLDK